MRLKLWLYNNYKCYSINRSQLKNKFTKINNISDRINYLLKRVHGNIYKK